MYTFRAFRRVLYTRKALFHAALRHICHVRMVCVFCGLLNCPYFEQMIVDSIMGTAAQERI